MRRTSLLLGGVLAGCMRIYADPELPDIKVQWNDTSCRDGIGDVEITLTSLDSDIKLTSTVACTDVKTRFVDLARERFHVVGVLLDDSGAAFSTSGSGDVDLRNGFDKAAGLYFDSFSNVGATWSFANGASCASLGASTVAVELSRPELPDAERYDTPCENAIAPGSVAPATYTIRMRALDAALTTVAVSPASAAVEITARGYTNAGAFVLTPCGAACP